MSWLRSHRYRIPRRTCQAGILLLFWLGAHTHLGVLTGDLSSSRLFRTVPLSDPFAALQILFTGAAISVTLALGAGIVIALYLVVGGRAFCAWVCPLNPLTDAAGWIKRRLHATGQFRVGRTTRYWIAALALVVSTVTGVAAFEAISPIGIVQRGLIFGPGMGMAVLGAILLLDVFVVRHGWCGSLCPLGAFYSLVGRGSLLGIGFNSERCDRCGDCVPVCPESHVIHFDAMEETGFVASGECLNCGRCLEACDRDALRFGSRFRPGLAAP